ARRWGQSLRHGSSCTARPNGRGYLRRVEISRSLVPKHCTQHCNAVLGSQRAIGRNTRTPRHIGDIRRDVVTIAGCVASLVGLNDAGDSVDSTTSVQIELMTSRGNTLRFRAKIAKSLASNLFKIARIIARLPVGATWRSFPRIH